jgi:hypothetical protein
MIPSRSREPKDPPSASPPDPAGTAVGGTTFGLTGGDDAGVVVGLGGTVVNVGGGITPGGGTTAVEGPALPGGTTPPDGPAVPGGTTPPDGPAVPGPAVPGPAVPGPAVPGTAVGDGTTVVPEFGGEHANTVIRISTTIAMAARIAPIRPRRERGGVLGPGSGGGCGLSVP